MAKAPYRSEMRIMHEILAITANDGVSGTNVSKIASKANLSHYAVTERCQRLIEAGVIELQVKKRNRIFYITERGRMFFQELDRFQDMVSSLNLKC